MAYGKAKYRLDDGGQNQPQAPADPLWAFGSSGRKEPARSPCCQAVVYFIMRNTEDDYYCSAVKCGKKLTTRKHEVYQPVGTDKASGE